jgi:polyferredoxin
MLKKIRVIVALLFAAVATLLFLDYTGTVHAYLGWCAKIQFVPAVLALIPAFFAVNIVIVVCLLLITLLFGRVYCSVVCPLGIFQDAVSWKAGWFKKGRFSYRPPKTAFVAARFVLLGIFVAAVLLAAIFNTPPLAALIEPYSAYGRMVAQLFAPLYKYGNNILAYFSERAGNYSFYTVNVWLTGVGAFVVAVLTFVTVSVFAWKSGRGYCNTICPAGAALAVISKFSIVKHRIDKNKCVNCGVCIKNCKAGCIDPVNKDIDYLRCVSCFNCIDCCSKKAMKYTTLANMKKK